MKCYLKHYLFRKCKLANNKKSILKCYINENMSTCVFNENEDEYKIELCENINEKNSFLKLYNDDIFYSKDTQNDSHYISLSRKTFGNLINTFIEHLEREILIVFQTKNIFIETYTVSSFKKISIISTIYNAFDLLEILNMHLLKNIFFGFKNHIYTAKLIEKNCNLKSISEDKESICNLIQSFFEGLEQTNIITLKEDTSLKNTKINLLFENLNQTHSFMLLFHSFRTIIIEELINKFLGENRYTKYKIKSERMFLNKKNEEIKTKLKEIASSFSVKKKLGGKDSFDVSCDNFNKVMQELFHQLLEAFKNFFDEYFYNDNYSNPFFEKGSKVNVNDFYSPLDTKGDENFLYPIIKEKFQKKTRIQIFYATLSNVINCADNYSNQLNENQLKEILAELGSIEEFKHFSNAIPDVEETKEMSN
ncbi:hypothetical protein EDEG_00599 [Edhazardia aedis USNM 41457]|uniref:Uncharacterized protein n=1 Tax=Edhazardia aedis (strain USNM 41457) TaxID=1003232 RepID=J9A0D1_EDHAE|nr:hypothetical protein EDEG_00599 [Edhazardia aedis USNM 41457]|eukprot:EJW05373.1 hypothetical protein EDEG_00599 [Edhazardia aedis USNM 41457]